MNIIEKWYRLHTPHIDPFWFNQIKGAVIEAEISEIGKVAVLGEMLTYDTSEINPEVGTKITVAWNGRNLVFKIPKSFDRLEETSSTLEQKKQADSETLNERRSDAEAFNSILKLPVKWYPSIKPVLSGLSEKGWGDGRYSKSVVHIRLEEPLEINRLIRERGDYLCTPENAGSWEEVASIEYWQDGAGDWYFAKVTCRKCIEIAQRISSQTIAHNGQ